MALAAGFPGVLVSMIILGLAYMGLRGTLEATLSNVTGVRLSFLPPLTVLGVISGGALIGGLGSALSLRRYLRV